MTMLQAAIAVEAATTVSVILLTIYIMQTQLMCAHHLLRLGFALVCAGAVLELYCVLAHDHMQVNEELIRTIVTNFGQVVVYLWVATSKRLPRILAEAADKTHTTRGITPNGKRIGN